MTQTKPKLTAKQKEVVKLMKQGWALSKCATMKFSGGGWHEGIRWWLQEGGLGRGGNTRNVRLVQFDSLYAKGVIKPKNDDHSSNEWELTEIGKRL